MVSIGNVAAEIPKDMPYQDRFAAAETNDVRCPIPEAAEAMRASIRAIMEAKDTLAGFLRWSLSICRRVWAVTSTGTVD